MTSVDEQYLQATNATNLRVVADKHGQADVLIAVGWSMSRVGAALLRLRSEWDSSAKPVPMPIQSVAALAQANRKPGKPLDMLAAQKQADKWFEKEMLIFRLKLKSLGSVLMQTALKMDKRGMCDTHQKAASVVGWWLNKTCQKCGGLGQHKAEDAPVLSGIRCGTCHGTGEIPLPYGEDGREVAGWLDDCLNYGRQATKARLRNF